MLCLEVKLPSGEYATVYPSNWRTLLQAFKIVERETGGEWVKASYPHTVQKYYRWKVHFSDAEPETVSIPKGATIEFWRNR